MVKMFSNYQISIISHVKYRIFTCVQIPHFSVVEILVKHCSLYNKTELPPRQGYGLHKLNYLWLRLTWLA